MNIVFSATGFLVALLLVLIFIWGARTSPLQALSMPCFMVMTSLIYFYLMPLAFLYGDDLDFFGLSLDDLSSVHLAVGLYAAGGMVAFLMRRRVLAGDPVMPGEYEQEINPLFFWGMMAIAGIGVLVKIALGRLAFGDEMDRAATEAQNLNFLELSDALLIALTIVFLLRDRFRARSLLFLAFTTGVFLTDGFRYRLVILLSAAVISFALTRRIKLRVPYVVGGAVLAIVLLNAMGMARHYGRGLDLSQVKGFGFSDLFFTFGGEVGPTFVLYHLTKNPAPPLIGFDPWIVAVARLVPSFLWADKPFPTYLKAYPDGFPDPNAQYAGIAGTQQAEFFMQFGWVGLPILAFLFFSLALMLQNRFRRISAEGRIAGVAILPPFFGFYAQQRGYTFQLVCELIFTVGPIFVMHWGGRKRSASERSAGPAEASPLGEAGEEFA